MKCISTCFSCWCSQNSARVTPSDPIQIVSSSNASKYRSKGDVPNGGTDNPNFSLENGETEENPEDNVRIKALFIEVGKDRLIRVIHIKTSDGGEDTEESPPASHLQNGTCPGSIKSPAENNRNTSMTEAKPDETDAPGEDEEDEYWFSKWARKPRFRSIFAKNPENRPKLGGNESNNNNSMALDETNKVTTELEMARAAAAAKRRAWAYNNNGNCESTITQQPTVTPGEEEFNSIAIVNTNKQQWSKQGNESSAEDQSGKDVADSSSSSSQVQVEVCVEKVEGEESSSKDGIFNPAFQIDEGDEYDQCETEKTDLSRKVDQARTSRNPSVSTSSVKSRSSSSSSTQAEEDAITSEPEQENRTSPQTSSKSLSQDISISNIAPKRPIIFFIHSVAGSSDVWHHQFEFFQQLGYEIVAPDLLGHGLSSTPLNPKYYFFESLVQDLILIFDHFCKDDSKVVLIGHGYGACLAAMLTRVRLKNVALLITIAGGGPTPLVRRTCCQDSWFAWKCKLFHSNRVRGRFDNPELKHVLPATIHENILSGQVWPDGDSTFYRRITVPTLLTYGMRDKVVTLVEECEMERTIPKSFLELIDSAGHMVMLDEPEKLNKMLCKFIQSWS